MKYSFSVSALICRVLRANPDSVAVLPRCALCGKMISRFPRFSIICQAIREIPEIRGQILSESFFHPGTGPGATGQVVIDNCRSTERHACGSLKERAEEERANPNDSQQEVMSRKNGASRKLHKMKQLQQIQTAVRHQGKTKTVNFSLFLFGANRS
jgi:hypothetical protein